MCIMMVMFMVVWVMSMVGMFVCYWLGSEVLMVVFIIMVGSMNGVVTSVRIRWRAVKW